MPHYKFSLKSLLWSLCASNSKSLFTFYQSSKIESAEESPATPPLSEERLPRNFPLPVIGKGMGYSSSESLDHHPPTQHNDHLNGHNGRQYNDSGCLASTPKLSSINGPKTETSSVDAASIRMSSEADRSEEVSVSAVSNASDQETEWVEQDEPGVYITIRALPGGVRELRRVRFRSVPLPLRPPPSLALLNY